VGGITPPTYSHTQRTVYNCCIDICERTRYVGTGRGLLSSITPCNLVLYVVFEPLTNRGVLLSTLLQDILHPSHHLLNVLLQISNKKKSVLEKLASSILTTQGVSENVHAHCREDLMSHILDFPSISAYAMCFELNDRSVSEHLSDCSSGMAYNSSTIEVLLGRKSSGSGLDRRKVSNTAK
jgi:hypothetical protein